jgi:3',5'-cyclic AMP phosphodiesterase CpdA
VNSQRILIAQISDLHIKAPGELAYREVDTAAALERCIAALNRFAPRLVVASGDLVDTPTAQEYEHLRRLLTALELPLTVVPGNHDDRALLRAAFPDQAYARATDALNSLHAVGPLDVVLVDSSVPGAPHGHLDAETLRWLEATLAAAPARPALIFLHHPPFVTGITHMDRQNLDNAGELAALIARHPRARLIAAGHVHRSVLTLFAGIPATICPAPNHAVALDLDALQPPSLMVEPPAFHLHAWFPGEGHGNVVTHLVPIGDFAGPYPFFDAAGRQL